MSILTSRTLIWELLLLLSVASAVAQTRPAAQHPVGEIYVQQVVLTDVYDQMGPGLNIGAVVADESFARGLQKAADVWGLYLDLFVDNDPKEREQIARHLIDNVESYIVVDVLPSEDWSALQSKAEEYAIPFKALHEFSDDRFRDGFEFIRMAYGELLPRIPKFDEVFPVAFPISPLPGSFFQPSKFPYPSPVVRAERTSESGSSSAHAHVSCNVFAQTGNMLHRTSTIDPDLFLMGMEGGNLALKALPGAADAEKMSALMTSWVIAVHGPESVDREILVENDAVESSFFKVGIHAPEELHLALERWKEEGVITNYELVDHETMRLEGFHSQDRILRTGMWLNQSERAVNFPELEVGIDARGRLTVEFLSTQQFIQQFAEVGPVDDTIQLASVNPAEADASLSIATPVLAGRQPVGGLITRAGASVANTIGAPLGDLLQIVEQESPPYQPYIFSLEGGFMVVTPEVALTRAQLLQRIKRVDLDLRGPLTSDQTILVTLEDDSEIVFRRTVLHFNQLDEALERFREQGMIRDWKYDGVRGQGLDANIVLEHFLGKHRKFMSSLVIWPTQERPLAPTLRMYVDGMQRLNMTFITSDGWRQEFVEVPLRMAPIPRDVELYSHISKLR